MKPFCIVLFQSFCLYYVSSYANRCFQLKLTFETKLIILFKLSKKLFSKKLIEN